MDEDVKFIRDLADRLRGIPTIYGTDDHDIDRLLEIAQRLDQLLAAKGPGF